ncbi:MAG: murein biosynthesis integral membrane protein MurJ [Polyangiaceae bacterium]
MSEPAAPSTAPEAAPVAAAPPAAAPPAAAPPARGALLVTAGILASRLIGLVRQRFVAHYLGTSDAADAVAAAFRVGNITQNLLGEGTLSASFIPTYARLRARSPSAAHALARAAFGWILLISTVLSILGAVFAPALAGAVAAGYEGDKATLTAELVRILFPMTGVLVVGAWSLGILTSHRRFLIPYAAPVLWSAAQIGALVIAGRLAGVSRPGLARAVAWGALAGAGLQLAVMLVPVRRILGGIAPSLDRSAEGLGDVVRRLPGAVLGRGILQISGLIDTWLVSFLGAGANATFMYAQTAYLLPMALLGTGEAAASLPSLSEVDLTNEAERRSMVAGLGRSLTRVAVLAVGATVVFVVLGPEVVTVLFRGGSFDQASSLAVASALAAYGAGLPANAASRIVSTVCFAMGDTRRPATFAAIRVVVSTAVSVVAMRRFGVPGVIFGAVVAAWIELALLTRAVRRALGATGFAEVPLGKLVLTGLAPALVGLGARYGVARLHVGHLLSALAVLSLAGGAFLVVADRLKVLGVRSLLRARRR